MMKINNMVNFLMLFLNYELQTFKYQYTLDMPIDYKFAVDFRCFRVIDCKHDKHPQKLKILTEIACGRIAQNIAKMMLH